MTEEIFEKKVGLEIMLIVLSYLSAGLSIIVIRLNTESIKYGLDFIGPELLGSILIALICLLQGSNLYLKKRELTFKETAFFLIRCFFITLPVIVVTDVKNLDSLVSKDNSSTFISIFILMIALYLVYKQLFRLVKNGTIYYKKIVTEKVDRLTIAITIFGTIIALIALFK